MLSMLEATVTEHVDDSVLESEVIAQLVAMSCGADPERACENLMALVYRASESSDRLSPQRVREWLTSIGKFVSARAAFHDEWHSTVIPLEDRTLTSQECDSLSKRFSEGQSAVYEHIVAGLDVPRPVIYSRIRTALRYHEVVVLRGASGQGKSTLAYRVCFDLAPSDWRFSISSRHIDSNAHAARVAFAIGEFKRALDSDLLIVVEASPGDVTWVVLVDELQRHQAGKVIVTVREEDWRRRRPNSVCAEVDFHFHKAEAKKLFNALSERDLVASPDFDEAWSRFGEGPLLEFVYFLKENQTLYSRLREQAENLRSPTSANYLQPDELQFLRAVMVVSMTGASCDVRLLAHQYNLPDAARTVSTLEEEFLIISHGDGSISGLHPLRSSLMSELLHDGTFNPVHDTIALAVASIVDQDVEAFCIYAFGRYPDHAKSIFSTLCGETIRSWTRFCGVQNAVMWWGIDSWLIRNEKHIVKAYETVRDGWFLLFDWNIASVGDVTTQSIFENMPNGEAVTAASIAAQNEAEQTTNVFNPLRLWWESQSGLPDKPSTEAEWRGLAEATFWIGHLDSTIQVNDSVSEDDFSEALNSLSLPTLADVCRGLESASSTQLHQWTRTYCDRLVERFRRHALVVRFEDDGSDLTAHGVIELDQEVSRLDDSDDLQKSTDTSLNDLAWDRVSMMRALFPEHQKFCFDGYGHDAEWLGIDLRQAHKSPPRENIESPWGPDLNHIFIQRGTRRFLPETWSEHFRALSHIRESVLADLVRLRRAISQRRQRDKKCLLRLEQAISEECRRLLNQGCPLPLVAVDEWGRSQDRGAKIPSDWTTTYRKTLQDYLRSTMNFMNQVSEVVLLAAKRMVASSNSERSEIAEQFDRMSHVSNVNLAHAGENLQKLQLIIAQSVLASHSVSSGSQNFTNELDSYRRTLCLWNETREFLRTGTWPAQHRQSKSRQNKKRRTRAKTSDESQFEKLHKRWLKSLKDEFAMKSNELVTVQVLSDNVAYNGLGSLWIGIDVRSIEAATSETLLAELLGCVTRAIGATLGSLESLLQQQLWHKVLFVPTLWGRSLFGRVYTSLDCVRHLPGEMDLSSDLWRLTPEEYPNLVQNELQIRLHQSPWLSQYRLVQASSQGMLNHLLHYHDFQRVPADLDDTGAAILQEYVSSHSDDISRCLTELITSFGELINLLPEESDDQYISEAIELTGSAWSLATPEDFKPGETLTISLDDLESYTCDLITCVSNLELAAIHLLAHEFRI